LHDKRVTSLTSNLSLFERRKGNLHDKRETSLTSNLSLFRKEEGKRA